jgi:hypothetical protein
MKTTEKKDGKRGTYLLVSQMNTLDTWAKELEQMFPKDMDVYGTYLVGSATQHKDFRDVDVRQIMSDKSFESLRKTVDIGYFNHVVSLWGQQLTGLPIDYQVQAIGSEENNSATGTVHHAIGMRDGYINGDRRQ